MSRNRVLLVDDEPDAVHLLRFALERAGCEVLTVERADDALGMAQSSAPDVVLLALEIGQHSARYHGERTGGQQHGDGLRVCRLLRLDPRTRHLPIMLVTGKLRSESDTVEGFRAGADDYVMKPFRPAEVVARVRALLERARRGRDVSPLTGLPDGASVQNQLQRLIASGQAFGALYADPDDFKIYNELYGFERGDEVLQAMAYCVTDAVAACCPDAFIGHTDGDTFVVTTTPDPLEPLAREIIARFDAAMPAWYPPEAVARGAVVVRDRRGETVEHPLLSLSIAGATNEARQFRNPLEVAAVAAEIKKALKLRPGSNYLKDRRTGRNRDALIA